MQKGILGYFALTFKEIKLADDLSVTKRRNVTGGFPAEEHVKSFLIGQLSKNFSVRDNPLNMSEILNAAYARLLPAHNAVGGRVILAECSKPLVKVYERYEFKHLQSGELEQVYRIFDPPSNR